MWAALTLVENDDRTRGGCVERPAIRAIDHLVLPVTTLTLARQRLTSLGFTVAPDARHPFGTGNCCVFFNNGTYLEPITSLDRNATDMAAAEGLVFVRRIKRFTERQGEGFAMLALASGDAEADHAAFTRAGIVDGPVYRFTRNATLPGGEEREIGVALAYTDFSPASDATFFACQHLAKDVLFQPAYLDHPNGATGVSSVVAVAETPAEFLPIVRGATGQIYVRSTPDGIEADMGGQTLLVLSTGGFRTRYELDPPNPRRGMLFAAFEVQVLDLERAGGYAGRAAKRQEGGIVVPAAPGLGAVIAFRSAPDG